MSFFGQLSKRATLQPKKIVEGTKQYQLKKYAEATLGSGNLRLAVVLPEGEDLNEWLAVNTVDFFNQINMLYGTVTEFCTPQECETMCAGPRFEYLWQDGVQYKKPTKLSAPAYVDCLMNWVQGMLDDESIFPSKIGVSFPKNFQATIKSIIRRLFRVYAHLYNHHFAQLCALSIEAHINTSYRHFLLFVTEFGLVEKKDLAPLSELNEGILNATDKRRERAEEGAKASRDRLRQSCQLTDPPSPPPVSLAFDMAPKKNPAAGTASLRTTSFNSSKNSIATASKSKPTQKKVDKEEEEEEEEIDPRLYSGLYREAQKKMGPPVHGEAFTKIDVILRVFDCTDEYGPASNVTRLERWERAEKMGLAPPPEIGEILRSQPGRTRSDYRMSSFNI